MTGLPYDCAKVSGFVSVQIQDFDDDPISPSDVRKVFSERKEAVQRRYNYCSMNNNSIKTLITWMTENQSSHLQACTDLKQTNCMFFLSL